MEAGHKMCRTRYRTTFPEYAEIPNQQVSHFEECVDEPNKGFALLKVRRRFSHGIRTAQSARILELQIETDKT